MTRSTRLHPGHADELAQLHTRAFRPEDAWDAGAFNELLAQPHTQAFGMFRDASLAAFILIQFVRPEAEILTIATAPAFQRLGLAGNLVRDAEQQLCSEGLEKWLLDVAADNDGALAFYRRIGFQEDGRRPDYYRRLEGTRIDAILMSKHVSRQVSM
jgi:ribosomal-protein-alanine N-acetyltransferase